MRLTNYDTREETTLPLATKGSTTEDAAAYLTRAPETARRYLSREIVSQTKV
jgi:hypothetical protein